MKKTNKTFCLSIADIALLVGALDTTVGGPPVYSDSVDTAMMELADRLAKEADIEREMDCDELARLVEIEA